MFIALVALLSKLHGYTQTTGENGYRDIYPDTWVATDGIGRTMPAFNAVGPVKHDQRRVVGIFYITWHSDNLANLKPPYSADVTKVLAEEPSARLDAKHPLWKEGSYHWGEPEAGYFLSKDEYVIRKDMSMLADAGVDEPRRPLGRSSRATKTHGPQHARVSCSSLQYGNECLWRAIPSRSHAHSRRCSKEKKLRLQHLRL